MVARKLRSPLSLVILGLLAEEPLHPYAMRQRMAERGHDRLHGVRPASLYDTLPRLAESGLVTADEPSRQGRRPERVCYELTPTGGETLRVWVAESLADPERAEEFPAALSFMFALGRDRAVALLDQRTSAVKDRAESAAAVLARAATDGVPPIFLSESHYQLALLHAEQAWLAAFVDRLRSGELAWPTPVPDPHHCPKENHDNEHCDV